MSQYMGDTRQHIREGWYRPQFWEVKRDCRETGDQRCEAAGRGGDTCGPPVCPKINPRKRRLDNEAMLQKETEMADDRTVIGNKTYLCPRCRVIAAHCKCTAEQMAKYVKAAPATPAGTPNEAKQK